MIRRIFSLPLLLGSSLLIMLAFVQGTSGSGTPGPVADKGTSRSPFTKCLPAGINLTTIVEVSRGESAKGQAAGPRKVTVEERLNSLGATCNGDNKLVDRSGKQIMFYHLI